MFLPQVLFEICQDYSKSWNKFAIEKINEYKLSWEDIDDHKTVAINWKIVLDALQQAKLFDELDCQGYYYLILLLTRNMWTGAISYDMNEILMYCFRGRTCQCQLDHHRIHENCLVLELIILLEMNQYEEGFRERAITLMGVEENRIICKKHPYFVTYLLELSDMNMSDMEYEPFFDTIDFVGMIKELIPFATAGDPHAQYALSRLYYRIDDNKDSNGDEYGSVWYYTFKQQNYRPLDFIQSYFNLSCDQNAFHPENFCQHTQKWKDLNYKWAQNLNIVDDDKKYCSCDVIPIELLSDNDEPNDDNNNDDPKDDDNDEPNDDNDPKDNNDEDDENQNDDNDVEILDDNDNNAILDDSHIDSDSNDEKKEHDITDDEVQSIKSPEKNSSVLLISNIKKIIRRHLLKQN